MDQKKNNITIQHNAAQFDGHHDTQNAPNAVVR